MKDNVNNKKSFLRTSIIILAFLIISTFVSSTTPIIYGGGLPTYYPYSNPLNFLNASNISSTNYTSDNYTIILTGFQFSLNTTYTNNTYYLNSNPRSFLNVTNASPLYNRTADNYTLKLLNQEFSLNTTYSNNTYYLKSNPLNFLNATNASVYNDTAYADSLLITTYYNTSNIEVVTGTGAGVLANIQTYDEISYNVSEVASDLDLMVNFTAVTSFNQVILRYLSVVGETHDITVYLWDNVTANWESYQLLGHTDGLYNVKAFGIFDTSNHISNGVVRIRLLTTNAGGSTDKWQFDWIGISRGVATPSSVETDPLSIHKDGTTPLTGNWNVGSFNITASAYFGNGSALTSVHDGDRVLNSTLTSYNYNRTADNYTLTLTNIQFTLNTTYTNSTYLRNKTTANHTDVWVSDNLTVVENITGVKCIVFANGFKVGSCG